MIRCLKESLYLNIYEETLLHTTTELILTLQQRVFTGIKMHSRTLFSLVNVTVWTFAKGSTLDLNTVLWLGGVDFSQVSQ